MKLKIKINPRKRNLEILNLAEEILKKSGIIKMISPSCNNETSGFLVPFEIDSEAFQELKSLESKYSVDAEILDSNGTLNIPFHVDDGIPFGSPELDDEWNGKEKFFVNLLADAGYNLFTLIIDLAS